ncbi:MAG: hypothetical protein H5T64_08225 [Chloroflexi bacterium]|nr:hypothetical protein [Chloroflexota bacterium]
MSSGANVRAIQALDDLKGALNRFAGEAQEVLQAAEQDIRRTEEWLQERLNHWRNEVQRRQEEVRLAEAALARCLASGYRDRDGHYHAPDCSAYEHALLQARVRLREAETELRNVQEWMRVVGQAAAAYRTQAQRLGRQLAVDIPSADALLEHKIADLQAYLAVAVPAGTGVISSVGSITQVGAVQWNVAGDSEEIAKLQEGLMRLEGTSLGQPIAAAIHEHGTGVRFGQTPKDVIAYFDPDKNEIVIHERFRDSSPNVIAAHLAHEGTHVQWDRDDSIDQEYYAFKAQAEVWNQVKGKETDEQCDWVSWMISLGEGRAKAIIRFHYPDLPESA